MQLWRKRTSYKSQEYSGSVTAVRVACLIILVIFMSYDESQVEHRLESKAKLVQALFFERVSVLWMNFSVA